MKSLLTFAMLLSSTAMAAKYDSEYTDISVGECKTIESSENDPNAEIDFYKGLCEGKGDYQVDVSGGDLRYSVNLIYKGLEIPLEAASSFHDPGSDLVEWRYKVVNGQKVYTSFIYRINADHYFEETGDFRPRSTLYVVRLARENTCVIGQVTNKSNMNKIARRMADDESRQCPTK